MTEVTDYFHLQKMTEYIEQWLPHTERLEDDYIDFEV
jgi:hypothetical protein